MGTGGGVVLVGFGVGVVLVGFGVGVVLVGFGEGVVLVGFGDGVVLVGFGDGVGVALVGVGVGVGSGVGAGVGVGVWASSFGLALESLLLLSDFFFSETSIVDTGAALSPSALCLRQNTTNPIAPHTTTKIAPMPTKSGVDERAGVGDAKSCGDMGGPYGCGCAAYGFGAIGIAANGSTIVGLGPTKPLPASAPKALPASAPLMGTPPNGIPPMGIPPMGPPPMGAPSDGGNEGVNPGSPGWV